MDIDPQAVEVTKLNLLLKCLEGETSQTLGFERALFRERALPDLGKNIQCGNSLIGTDIIGDLCWVNYGAQVSSRVKGKFGKNHVLRDEPVTNTCRKTVRGRDLYRYRVKWNGKYVEWALAPEMCGPRDPQFFELPKLMIRDITGTHRLEITFDDSGLYCDHTILLAQRYVEAARWRNCEADTIKRSKAYSYEMLTGLLCSRAVSAFDYLKLTGEGVRTGGGFHTYPKTIRVLPVFDLTRASDAQRESAHTIEELAGEMLTLHKSLAAEKNPQRREQIERQIAATDRQIDQLVYQLYGLSDEEIRIVEEATA